MLFGAVVNKITEITVPLALKFVGHGPVHPICCCIDSARNSSSQVCGMVASMNRSNAAECPKELRHDPAGCEVREIVEYVGKTVSGCTCRWEQECGHNKPFKGHAWCRVWGVCGHRGLLGRWDYCAFGGDPLVRYFDEVAADENGDINEVLAEFVPNTRSRAPTSPFRWSGSYTDKNYATTTVWEGCFAAVPAETLGECAQACLVDGAVSENGEVFPCAAFAFNHGPNLCLRLPASAVDAVLTPYLRQWNGNGWQNFEWRHNDEDGQKKCSSEVFADIRSQGYEVVQDKNDGYLRLQCRNDESATMWASCRRGACTSGTGWCFIPEKCGFSRRCKQVDPLVCG